MLKKNIAFELKFDYEFDIVKFSNEFSVNCFRRSDVESEVSEVWSAGMMGKFDSLRCSVKEQQR